MFYLYVGRRFATGKTSALGLAVRLAGATLLENTRGAALARLLERAGLVALDKIDVPRGAEFDAARDSLLRQGYRRGDTE